MFPINTTKNINTAPLGKYAADIHRLRYGEEPIPPVRRKPIGGDTATMPHFYLAYGSLIYSGPPNQYFRCCAHKTWNPREFGGDSFDVWVSNKNVYLQGGVIRNNQSDYTSGI